MAASATFALKAGLWVRRARLAIVAPDMRHSRRSQAETQLIDLSEFGQPPLTSKLFGFMRFLTWTRRNCSPIRCLSGPTAGQTIVGNSFSDQLIRWLRYW